MRPVSSHVSVMTEVRVASINVNAKKLIPMVTCWDVRAMPEWCRAANVSRHRNQFC